MKISEMFIGALGAIALLLIFGLVGNMDYEDHLAEVEHYCDMRFIYEQDRRAGVPEQNRAGWPNFKDDQIECGVSDVQ